MRRLLARETVRQLFVFGLVGGTSALIDFALFWVLTRFGLIPGVASAISFLSAFAVNYQGNKSLVFKAAHTRGALWRYIVLVVVNLGLSSGGVTLGVAIGLPSIVAKLISMVIVAVVNFIAMRLWVFRHRPTDALSQSVGPGRPARSD